MAEKKTTEATAPVDQVKLETVALRLYAERAGERGYDPEKVAHDSFRLAKSFLSVAEKIRTGELTADPEVPLAPMFVEREVWQQQSDEKWDQNVDPLTNKPVMETVAADRFAYAPNLPDNHPINQSFRPLDGIPPSKRTGKRIAALVSSN